MDVYRKAKVNNTPAVSAVPNDVPAAGGGGGGMNASIAPLITMIAVLAIILIFCFCGAPAVRAFCRKRVCYCCPPHDEETAGASDNSSTTPTIILLPFGRMLVVDRSVFAEFEAETAGLDLMQLSANLIRAHRRHLAGGSSSSFFDSEPTSKAQTPATPPDHSPPPYEEICDLPPAYSDLAFSVENVGTDATVLDVEAAAGVVLRVASESDVYYNRDCRNQFSKKFSF